MGVKGSLVVGKLLAADDHNIGFDTRTKTYVNMIEPDIIDPAKVVRTELQDAGSVEALLFTTVSMIAVLAPDALPT